MKVIGVHLICGDAIDGACGSTLHACLIMSYKGATHVRKSSQLACSGSSTIWLERDGCVLQRAVPFA